MNHKTQRPVPTNPDEKREWIQWLLDHRVWRYSYTMTPEALQSQTAMLERLGFSDVPIDCTEGSLQQCWDLDVAYLDPDTLEYPEDSAKGTLLTFLIEAGPWYDCSTDPEHPVPHNGWNDYNRWMTSHDYRLDCGGGTMADALLMLASKVGAHYNEDGTDKDLWPCGFLYTPDDKGGEDTMESKCTPEPDGEFCSVCGFHMTDDVG